MISAVFSRFSGGLRGYETISIDKSRRNPYWFREKKVMVLWLYAKIFEYGIRPEPFHMIL
jgi:hypothetical protein